MSQLELSPTTADEEIVTNAPLAGLTVRGIVIKTAVTHTVTYIMMGLLASWLFDYRTLFSETSLNLMMRPIDDPWVMAGPLFQPIRGVLFGLVFYLLRESVFGKKNGWLTLWLLLIIVGIFSTFGPPPGSIEGMIYTTLPFRLHFVGLPEVILQALLLSMVLFYWIRNPMRQWLSWLMWIACIILMALPALGLLAVQFGMVP